MSNARNKANTKRHFWRHSSLFAQPCNNNIFSIYRCQIEITFYCNFFAAYARIWHDWSNVGVTRSMATIETGENGVLCWPVNRWVPAVFRA
jgi:hypothetical protein